jgi:hypothetical protein
MNLTHQQLKNLQTLFFKDIYTLKDYIEENFEEVEFDDNFAEELDDECDFYNLMFDSKYHDYILYYLKTRNDHIVVVDALPLNK